MRRRFALAQPRSANIFGMYQYQPPKSNSYGHRLRNIPAARAKELFERFLSTAVAEYHFFAANLSIVAEGNPRTPQMCVAPSGACGFNAPSWSAWRCWELPAGFRQRCR